MSIFLEHIFLRKFWLYFCVFLARDSAEASAEASVDLAEASVSAESRFRAIRSFTTCKDTFMD